jgi:hypothetical protein
MGLDYALQLSAHRRAQDTRFDSYKEKKQARCLLFYVVWPEAR